MPFERDHPHTPAFNSASQVWLAEFNNKFVTDGGNCLNLLSGDSSIHFAQDTSSGILVIFHGVLYNRTSLANVPNSLDSQWISEAQLILELYRKSGERIIGSLRGIYAALIYDQEQGKLLAFRDPLGFCPLFYSDTGSSLLFSNSIDMLLAHPNVSREINRAALADYLSRRWPEYDETYYVAVKRVLTGHYLERVRDMTNTHQYWEPSPPDTPDESFTVQDLDEFDGYLEQAVQRCYIFGDVGIYLSGGLDSVSIAAMATDLARTQGLLDPLALSLAFPDPACNEEEVQRSVAAGLGINQIIIPFDDAVRENGLIYETLLTSGAYPQPLQNPWRIAYINLALLGKEQGYRVILTGGGGDDWLTVNLDHMADLVRYLKFSGMKQMIGAMLKSYHAPRIQVIRYLLWTIGLRPVLASNGRRVLYKLAPGPFNEFRRKRMLNRAQTPAWVAPDPELQQQLDMRTQNMIERTLLRPEPSGPYGFYKHDSRSATFSHPILTLELEEDFEVGRQHDIKLLHPYWDPDLIQYLCRIPPRLLLSGGREKGIVRQAIANRFPNLGFEKQRKVIAGNFIQNILKNTGKENFNRFGGLQYLMKYGIITQLDDQYIDRILASHDLVDNYRIWELLTLEAWVRSHS